MSTQPQYPSTIVGSSSSHDGYTPFPTDKRTSQMDLIDINDRIQVMRTKEETTYSCSDYLSTKKDMDSSSRAVGQTYHFQHP